MRYQCKICFKKFIQIGTLKRHCETHGIPAKNVEDIIIRLNPTNFMVSYAFLIASSTLRFISADPKATGKRALPVAWFFAKICIAILAAADQFYSILSSLLSLCLLPSQFFAKPSRAKSKPSNRQPVQQSNTFSFTNAELNEYPSWLSSTFCKIEFELQFLLEPDHPVPSYATVPTIL